MKLRTVLFYYGKNTPIAWSLKRATHGIRTHDLRITNALLYQLS